MTPGVQEKEDPLDPRSYLPPSRSLEFLVIKPSFPGVPSHPFIPTDYIAPCRLTLTAPSNQPDFGDMAINRNTYGVTNRLAFSWENYVQVLRLPNTLQPRIPSGVETKTSPQSNACIFPETGSHVDNLYNCQGQTREFSLILFE